MILRMLCQQGLSRWIKWCWMFHLDRLPYVHFGYPFTDEQLTSYTGRFGSRWDAMDDKNKTVLYGVR
jgi:hypothetical protein